MLKDKIQYILILFSMTFLIAGCYTEPDQADALVSPIPYENWQGESVGRRFQSTSEQNTSVVESAMELSEKYADLSDEALVLRSQNDELIEQKKQLEQQVASFQEQLNQTQKELNEANEVLIEMRSELNNWKSDVLGFREEMRNAEKAQLEALLKILEVLGGDIPTQTAKKDDSGSVVALSR